MKKRILGIDFAKGLAIYLVVIAHVIQFHYSEEQYLYRLMNSFLMPLFFILSGFTFTKNYSQSIRDYIMKKSMALGKPYLLFILVMFLKNLKYYAGDGKRISKLDLYNTLFMTHDSIFSKLWFLPTLFIAEIILFIIYKKATSRCIPVIIAVIIGIALKMFVEFPLPFCFDTACVATGFVYLGQKLYEVRYSRSNDNTICPTIVRGSLLLGICLITNYIAFKSGIKNDGFYRLSIGNPFIFIVTSLTGSLGVIELSTLVKKSNIICKFGLCSVYIYGFHYIVIGIVNKVVALCRFSNNICNSLIVSFAVTLYIYVVYYIYVTYIYIYFDYVKKTAAQIFAGKLHDR